MAYTALYRTYRPQKFSDVFGQQAIVKTLKNAIKNNKISHAYLFSGPRGIGKTSIARILAKALNCASLSNGEPCCECQSCQEIAKNAYPDVIEIDAASNNGVDEIRDLRDKVKFLPAGSKYKIYIIDEVHMLTTGAFNALLKTLEEPPKHAIFILATTEVHKLPATIVSRCQCFEFKALTVSEISTNLEEIANKENIKISKDALDQIAIASEGGMRDALGLLDKTISYTDEEISVDTVNEITGNLNYEKMIELAKYLESNNVTNSIQLVNDLIANGKEETKIVNSLIQFYRDILIYKNVQSETFDKQMYQTETFQELARQIPDNRIFYYIDVLSDIQSKMKYSSTPHVFLEISLIKIINASADMINLSKRLNDIEDKVNNFDFSSIPTSGGADNEKVVVLETRLAKVVTHLNQLEIPKLIEKVKALEIKLENFQPKNDGNASTLEHIQEQLLLLKTNVSALESQVDNSKPLDLSEITERLEQLDKKITDVPKTNVTNELQEKLNEIESLKVSLTSHKYTSSVEYDLTEIKDKIVNIENKLYKYIAVILGHEQTPIKKTKAKAAEVLAASEDGLFSLEKTLEETKVKADFEDIATQQDANPFLEIDTSIPLEAEASVNDNPSEDEDSPVEAVTVITSTPKEEVVVFETPTETIISKPNSQLYKKIPTEEPSTPIEDNSIKDLFAQETVELEKHIESFNESIETKKQVADDEFSSYDISVVERIMYDAYTPEAKNDRSRIIKLWNVLLNSVPTENAHIAQVLQQGTITAVGNKEFILIYPDSTMCNMVMRLRFKKDSLKLLYDLLGDTYNYIALPASIWENKRAEFRSQYYIGIKFPKLTPIDDPTLTVIQDNQEYLDEKEKAINKVQELFGKDFVNVE